VVIALIVTPAGLPLAYEVMAGKYATTVCDGTVGANWSSSLANATLEWTPFLRQPVNL
jgi:hypothetical protein